MYIFISYTYVCVFVQLLKVSDVTLIIQHTSWTLLHRISQRHNCVSFSIILVHDRNMQNVL